MPAYRIRVSIDGCQPPCVRTMLVPTDFSFLELSGAINIAMDWWEGHPYEFIVPSRQVTLADMVEETGTYRQMPESTPISDFEGDLIVYTYDFGDEWTHDIEFEGTDPDYNEDFPRMVSFEGRSPPEDCGGIWGYADLLDALADPANPRHGELSAWADGMGFGDFSMEETDEDLQMVRHGMFHPFGESDDPMPGGGGMEREYPEDGLDGSFWEDMVKYRGFDPGDCLRVDCPVPRPTYRDLDGEPLDWYLHWRSECESGNATPEDPGYIWLYITELVNSEDPAEALTMLEVLARAQEGSGDYSALHALTEYRNALSARFRPYGRAFTMSGPLEIGRVGASDAGLLSGVSINPKYSSIGLEDLSMLCNRTADALDARYGECGALEAMFPGLTYTITDYLCEYPLFDRDFFTIVSPSLEIYERRLAEEHIPRCVANAMWRLDHERGGPQVPGGFDPAIRDIAKRVVRDWADGKEFDPKDYSA